MRLTQVVSVESYTRFQGYTQNHFMGNESLTVESKCILIMRSVLFIIRSILLLLLFRSIYFFICNYFRVKEAYTNNSILVPC